MFLGKEVRVILRGDALNSFLELKKKNDQNSLRIIKSIDRVIEILKQNPQFGDPIRKEIIPNEFIKIGIRNLYRVELSNYWRLIYTLEGNRIEIFAFVLKIFDHQDYNKLFGYKRR